MISSQSRAMRIGNAMYVGLFLAALAAPLGIMLRQPPQTVNREENRVLAEFPKWQDERIQGWPRKVDAYLNDHFGGRQYLVRLLNLFKVRGLGVSTSPDVLLGKDGWLFYAAAGQMEDYQGRQLLKSEQLQQWQNVLEGRKAWLARRGIQYLFVVAPNTTSIYPEYLPDHVRASRGTTRLEQLLRYLREHSQLEIVDLRDALWQAKASAELYARNDTHWNDHGALVAYQVVCRRLAESYPQMQPLGLSDFIALSHPSGGDLGIMLGLKHDLLSDYGMLKPRVAFRAKPAPLALDPSLPWPIWSKGHPPVALENGAGQRRLLVFQDSFFANLPQACLAEHFRRSVFVYARGDYPLLQWLVEHERPDVIVEEWVERVLCQIPQDHPEFLAARQSQNRIARATACRDSKNGFKPSEALLAGNRLRRDNLQAVLPAHPLNPFSRQAVAHLGFPFRITQPCLVAENHPRSLTVP